MDAKTKGSGAGAPSGDGPKYPHVRVDLAKEPGNAFAVLNRTGAALREAGIPASERRQYLEEAISGDLEQLLSVTKRWVSTYEGRVSIKARRRTR
ncbi:MAG: hypothetical protein ACLQKK_10155 [Rhodomicrobium sp.]